MALIKFFIKNKLLVVALILGFFLFTYKLSSIPSGIYSDEAVVGYNSYSILKTGKDEYGKILPINLKFFGSYTPGFFVYLQIIPIKILGLNNFSIRLWSVISMLFVAIGIYFFYKNNQLLKNKLSPFLGTILFIITPWTVFNARLGYETTMAFAVIAIGFLFYKKPIISFTLISLSTYFGHTERYLAPLLILLIYFIFYFRKKEKIFWPIFWAFLIQIPNLILIFTPSFWVKNGGFDWHFIERYVAYFSPLNLFNREDYQLQRSIPELAVFYSWMFVPWLTGLYVLYKNWNKKIYRLILGLTLICPIPAALASVDYSTQRALPLLLPYLLLIGIGMDKLISKFKIKYSFPILLGLIFFSLLMLWRSYFIFLPQERYQSWNGGFQELSQFIEKNSKKHFVVDNSRTVSYIELLYFLKYSPEKYLQENKMFGKNYYQDISFNGDRLISNIEVRPIKWKEDVCKDQILVGDGLSISEDQAKEHFLNKVFEIKDVYRQIILQAYETNPKLKCGNLQDNSDK